MDEPIDKGLETEESLSTVTEAILPFDKPSQFVHIPDNVIQGVSQYMAIVINTGTPGRNVEIQRILENAKSMFREGERYHNGHKHNDNLWMQHCAASVREIISFIEAEHFGQAYVSIPQLSQDPQADRTFSFLKRANAYLSDVVHFQDSSKVGHAEDLYPRQGYGQTDHEEFIRDERIFFEKVCIDVVYALHHLFTTYCMGSEGNEGENETS